MYRFGRVLWSKTQETHKAIIEKMGFLRMKVRLLHDITVTSFNVNLFEDLNGCCMYFHKPNNTGNSFCIRNTNYKNIN